MGTRQCQQWGQDRGKVQTYTAVPTLHQVCRNQETFGVCLSCLPSISSIITQTGYNIHFKVTFSQIRQRSNYLFETINSLVWGFKIYVLLHIWLWVINPLGVYLLHTNVGYFNTFRWPRSGWLEVFVSLLRPLFFLFSPCIPWPRNKCFWKTAMLIIKNQAVRSQK